MIREGIFANPAVDAALTHYETIIESLEQRCREAEAELGLAPQTTVQTHLHRRIAELESMVVQRNTIIIDKNEELALLRTAISKHKQARLPHMTNEDDRRLWKHLT